MLVVAESGEPHLPIQPGLIWGHETGPPCQITGLVFELIIEPGHPVVAALNNDFGAIGGHHREQAVVIKAAERSEPAIDADNGPRPGKPQPEQSGELHGWDQDGDARQWEGDLNGPPPEVA